jgi:CAAX prenyl protease-like protein
MFGANPKERAYLAPFLAFFIALALGSVVAHFGDGRAFWVFSQPRYWVCPLQTMLCAALLIRGWPQFELQPPRRPLFTIGIGVLALLLWVAPQAWLGAPRRIDGFNPAFFGSTGWPFAVNLGLRLLRLIVVVPLLEEIFWRGFLLRYLIEEDFARVPVGTFSWLSFGVVTVGFCFEHSTPDWPAAILTGALYNLVAYRTRSLSSCVLVHAVTNALLGAYVLYTRQWGFW